MFLEYSSLHKCVSRGQLYCWTRSTEEGAELCRTYLLKNDFLLWGWKTAHRPNRIVTHKWILTSVCVQQGEDSSPVCSAQLWAPAGGGQRGEAAPAAAGAENGGWTQHCSEPTLLEGDAQMFVLPSLTLYLVIPGSTGVKMSSDVVCFPVQGCLCLPGSDSGGISARLSEHTWLLHIRSAPVSFRLCVCVCVCKLFVILHSELFSHLRTNFFFFITALRG